MLFYNIDKMNKRNINIILGNKIPFKENHFDFLICTEVLEHVENYQQLVDEIYRVLKPNAKALITIPWSARFHYIPYDYFRYTPTTLLKMFSHFKDIEIIPRGTDVTSIAAKLIVLFVRNILPNNLFRYLFMPFWLITSPIVIIGIILGHISLVTRFGNDSDPLGYTIVLKK
jgi:SAM-dependent methyltransferase